MKAQRYEDLLASKLRGIFNNQRKEALASLKEGARDHLISMAQAEQDFWNAAFPILQTEILEAVEDARNLVRPRNPHKDESIEGVANQNSINWLKTRMEWAAKEEVFQIMRAEQQKWC